MPQKLSLRTRTWGTRFDNLPSSPPISPQVLAASTDHDPAIASNTITTTSDTFLKQKEDRMPHDASVFVGSLPSNIDQPELTRLLSDHLSEHTEVKNIKVVRDSKGGVCAFVQCEDASSAATLIHTLHSTAPKPFLGRVLRYEPARAFRTLLISYRTPMQFVPASTVDGANNLRKEGKNVELDPPYAMRLWRPKDSKFFSLLYNAEAIEAETQANALLTSDVGSSGDASLYLQPVAFDEESIHKIAAHFGRLERFGPFHMSGNELSDIDPSQLGQSYPTPHNAPRTAIMDETCWEIKWDHRDDCVSALMTLRRVPHLTVTWAHQPPSFTFEQHHSPYQNSRFHHPSSASYPLHVQDRPYTSRARSASLTTPHSDPFRHIASPSVDGLTIRPTHPDFASAQPLGDINDDRWKAMLPAAPALNSPRSTRNMALVEKLEDGAGTPVSTRTLWTDTDFPPLGDSKGDRKTECGVWGERKVSTSTEELERSPSSTLPDLPSDTDGELNSVNDISNGNREDPSNYQDEAQEIDMPSTPGLGMSPITPKTSGSLFPNTPTSSGSDIQRRSFKGYESTEHANFYGDLKKELDPTTLFVGGLEMFGPGAWDEEKVGNFFARFGGLEHVKVVRPLNSRAAFAFVKFNNTESPARAVFEEHNRVYEGRAMRVQLRDCNPPRGSWRHVRGRGRYQHQNFGSHRRYLDIVGDSVPEDHLQTNRSKDLSFAERQVGLLPYGPTTDDGQEEVDPNKQELPATESPKTERGDPSVNILGRTSPGDSRSLSPELSSTTPEGPSKSENYREWYDEPVSTPALTPPPSSLGSSASASASVPAPTLPYHVPNVPYYAPPWVHPYAPSMPFQMPYFGYPGFPLPGQQAPQTFASPVGSDISSPAPGVPSPWPSAGMYGSFVPYPAPPPKAQNTDAGQPQASNNQAPLLPTGFMQYEQGALIAVYQPEALEQYMASSQVGTPSQSQNQSVPNWTQYPPPHCYPFVGPGTQAIGMPPRPFQTQVPPGSNMSWIPTHPPPGSVPHHQASYTASPSGNNHNHSPQTFRGGYHDMGGAGTGGVSTGSPLRRQPFRRDQQNTFNQNRNNHGRPFAARNSRGSMNSPGYSPHGDQSFGRSGSHFNSSSEEWSQWAQNR